MKTTTQVTTGVGLIARSGRRAMLALLCATSLCAPWAALADSGRQMPAQVPPVYLQECAACHLAYPPGLLPAPSWRRMLAGLDRHYGSDASIDADSQRQIDAWLQRHFGTYKRVREEPSQDRITLSAWFQRKHRKVSDSTWQLPSVRSAAQCAACHTRAEQGDFDDDRLQFPEGLDPRQRRAWAD